jgi:hypothetical protein
MTIGRNSQCTRKCRKNEYEETKSMIEEMVWNKYLQEDGLDKYSEIVKLFDSDSEAIKLVTEVSHFLLRLAAGRPVRSAAFRCNL